MKINQLTPKQKKLLNKFVDTADIVIFDKDSIVKRIKKANELRNKAHAMMLEADTLLNDIQKELLYGKTN